MKTKISEQQKALAIELYPQFKSVGKLSKVVDISETHLYRLLHAANVPVENKVKSRVADLSDEQMVKVGSLYSDGYSMRLISEMTDISEFVVDKALSKLKMLKRTNTEHLRKYEVNDKFFDTIDTEEAAYFLGLMYSDGNVHNNTMRLTLQDTDKHILESFRDLISPSYDLLRIEPPKLHHRVKYQFWVCHPHLVEQLASLGCVPNKSLILKWPEWLVDADMQRHFIRGFFDGDGSIKKDAKQSHFISFVSTEQFVVRLSELIKERFDIRACFTKPNLNKGIPGSGITTTLHYGGNRQVERILNWLYKDANYYLERKHKHYLQLLERIAQVDAKWGDKYKRAS